MCTVLLAFHCVVGTPVILAANRDEFFQRLAPEPEILADRPRIVGGRDPVSTGTWLGISADGRIATVTNRLAGNPDPTLSSRGGIPLDLLLGGDWSSTEALFKNLKAAAYNPFNLLCVSPQLAVVAHATGSGRVVLVELTAGPHVLTLGDVDQLSDSKVSFLTGHLHRTLRGTKDASLVLNSMEEVLSEHGDENRTDLAATCVHGVGYGTLSSTSVTISDSGSVAYRYAPGPPCQTEYKDLTHLLSSDDFGSRTSAY